MNKNSVIGFTLIGAVLIGFSWYNAKNFKEQEKIRVQQDSIALASKMEIAQELVKNVAADTTTKEREVGETEDKQGTISAYRDSSLIRASEQVEELKILENKYLKIEFSNIGAQPKSVQIKNYKTYDSLDLYLIKDGKSDFSLEFFTKQQLSTRNFGFDLHSLNDTSLIYRLYFDSSSFVEYTYTLPEDSYMMNLDIRMTGMNRHIPKRENYITLGWSIDIPRLEKGYSNEKNYSTIAYKYPNSNNVENLGLRKMESSKEITTKVNWFAYQQQFFSAILIAQENFNSGYLSYSFYPEDDSDKNLMHCKSEMKFPYSEGDEVSFPFKFYYGPNHFKTLKAYGSGFEKIVPLGGSLIGWINRYIIILVFDLLGSFINSYGLIILLLTILIKLVISPLTLKSYVSSAKMKVLKPEVDKINAKYPKSDDAMKKQQEIMALYKKTGVSMFGGCLPMLLQFPILFAMFRFFPASFELRQESFLWAEDLSAYDSILDLPFNIPLYGDHVSLFALLMAISMFFYSKMNAEQMGTGPQMAGMKFMSVYFMPLFLLVLCNNFSSGLSYYYMLSNFITIGQTWVIRKYFVDEQKILAKLKEKADIPKKKSKFQERLDEAYRVQQQAKKKK